MGEPQLVPQLIGPQHPIDTIEMAKHVTIKESRIITRPSKKNITHRVYVWKLSAGKALLIKKNYTIRKLYLVLHFAMTCTFNLSRSKSISMLIASVIACTLSGCGDANRSKIIGTWGIAQADTIMNRIQTADSKPVGGGASEFDPGPPKMILKFLRNGRLETSTRMGEVAQEKQGTWKFVSFDETANTMTLACDIQDQVSEHKIEFLDLETIKLIPPNMAGTKLKLKFRRQN